MREDEGVTGRCLACGGARRAGRQAAGVRRGGVELVEINGRVHFTTISREARPRRSSGEETASPRLEPAPVTAWGRATIQHECAAFPLVAIGAAGGRPPWDELERLERRMPTSTSYNTRHGCGGSRMLWAPASGARGGIATTASNAPHDVHTGGLSEAILAETAASAKIKKAFTDSSARPPKTRDSRTTSTPSSRRRIPWSVGTSI